MPTQRERALSEHDRHILDALFDPEDEADGGERLADAADASDATRRLELAAIKLAESQDDYPKAIEMLTAAIAADPTDPSPLNNRAQVYRLMHEDAGAMQDLDQAIQVGEAAGSDGQRRIALRQAYTQRGWLKFVVGRSEDAFADFEAGARLGSVDARRMAVRCNPYAAMCNAMLHEVFAKMYS